MLAACMGLYIWAAVVLAEVGASPDRIVVRLGRGGGSSFQTPEARRPREEGRERAPGLHRVPWLRVMAASLQ